MNKINELLSRNQLHFISNIPNTLKCTLCHHVLNNACYSTCGCRFCSGCIIKYLDDEEKQCPNGSEECQETILQYRINVMPDPASNRDVSALKVRCPYKDCLYECLLKTLPNHMRICEKSPVLCVFSEIGCGQDGLLNETLKEHLHSNVTDHSRLLLDFVKNVENEVHSKMDDMTQKMMDAIALQRLQFAENLDLLKKEHIKQRDEWCDGLELLKDEMRKLKSHEIIVNNRPVDQKCIKEIVESENKEIKMSKEELELLFIKLSHQLKQYEIDIGEMKKQLELQTGKLSSTELEQTDIRRKIQTISMENESCLKQRDELKSQVEQHDAKLCNLEKVQLDLSEKLQNISMENADYVKLHQSLKEEIKSQSEKITGTENDQRTLLAKVQNFLEVKEQCDQIYEKEFNDMRLVTINIKEHFDEKIMRIVQMFESHDAIGSPASQSLQNSGTNSASFSPRKIATISNIDCNLNQPWKEFISFSQDRFEFFWKVDNISLKWKRYDAVCSSEFSTSEGYHLRLRLWLGLRTGLQIMFQLVKGPKDENLRWPMTNTLTISVLDFESLQPVIKKSVNYELMLNKKPFEKPIQKENTWVDAVDQMVKYSDIRKWSKDEILIISCSVSDLGQS